MELYIVQGEKKINILQLEPTTNSSFPKSNYSSFTVMLTFIDSCRDPERHFANEQEASLLPSYRQKMREAKKKTNFPHYQ